MSCWEQHAAMKLDRSTWEQLEYVGRQPVEAGTDPTAEPAYELEMRNCGSCQSTLCIEVQP